MAEDDRKGYRDELGAALEKAAHLEDENRRLREELARMHDARDAGPRAPTGSTAVHAPSASGISILGAVAVIGLTTALFVTLRASPSPHAPLPPLATIVAIPPAPSPFLPAPFHLYDTMPSATVAPPTAGPNERYVEVRSLPSGATVERGGKVLGKTPLFVDVAATSAGACSPGICSGGACTGATCAGATCTGQTCPHGFACRGGDACTAATCTGAACSGAACADGACAADACAGGTCSGTCTGGTCVAITPLVLVLGRERRKVELTADEPVVGHLFLGRKFP